MRVLYHITRPDNMYAMRLMAEGYRDAFRDLGHTFAFVSIRDNFSTQLRAFSPDLLVLVVSMTLLVLVIPEFRRLLLPLRLQHRALMLVPVLGQTLRDLLQPVLMVSCFSLIHRSLP